MHCHDADALIERGKIGQTEMLEIGQTTSGGNQGKNGTLLDKNVPDLPLGSLTDATGRGLETVTGTSTDAQTQTGGAVQTPNPAPQNPPQSSINVSKMTLTNEPSVP